MTNIYNFNRPMAEEYASTVGKYLMYYFDGNVLKFHNNKDSCKSVTFQVTEDCNLACTYCYQGHKTTKAMDWKVMKDAIDCLLKDESLLSYQAIILDFIGGEPFLKIDLIEKATWYYFSNMMNINPLLASRTRISICSNGLLYFDERVEKFMDKFGHFISFNITVDGDKELHDMCRVTPAGEPSYDLAIAASNHWRFNKGKYMGSKITISPENLHLYKQGIIHFIENGYDDIYSNCVFEAEWTYDEACFFFEQMIAIANYVLKNDLEDKIYLSIFGDELCRPKKDPTQNWCGGNGKMLAIGYDGTWYPCLRYMPSSIGEDIPQVTCGNIYDGIDWSVLEEMQKVVWETQNTQECLECNIAEGCANCTAWDYQSAGGVFNKRFTGICNTHKARTAASYYFYNQICKKHEMDFHYPEFPQIKDIDKILSQDIIDKLINNEYINLD